MRKPFNNKSNYDPGRFNHYLSFMTLTAVKSSSGGTKPNITLSFNTKAVKEQIREGSQISVAYGVNSINNDAIFIIRSKSGTVKKNMQVYEGNDVYEVAGIIPTDDPVNYIKVVCRKLEQLAIYPTT